MGKSRSLKASLPKPKSGGKPKKITTSAPPGGWHTPGAKAKKKAKKRGKPVT